MRVWGLGFVGLIGLPGIMGFIWFLGFRVERVYRIWVLGIGIGRVSLGFGVSGRLSRGFGDVRLRVANSPVFPDVQG